MVSKVLPAPSEVLMCEASILPYASIQRSAWKVNSQKFVCRMLHIPVPIGSETANSPGLSTGSQALHVLVAHKDPRV